ncbi:hypothetical protein FRC07_005483, partial [Ceratobasidium sp. 392]
MSTAYENISYGVRSMSSAMNSRPSSPHSAPALPSPPTSPNLHSVSVPGSPSSLGSFPSALSAAGSIWSLEETGLARRATADEPEVAAFSSHEHPESAHHLVIPSLALGPSLVSAPAPAPDVENAYGEALGNVRLLVLGAQRSLADNLLMRSPHVVHIHGWDQPTGDVPASLEASTILADRERNVRLTVMPAFDPRDNDSQARALSRSASQNGLESQHTAPPPLSRHATQRPTSSIPQSPQVNHMLASQHLYADRGRQPGVVPLRGSRQTVSAHASPPFGYSMPVSATASPPFPPPPADREYVLHLGSMGELAYVLFHSPRALASLRDAAAARFVSWREREREISEDRARESRTASRESRATGFLGFEDVDAGQSEQGDEADEQEAMVMRTMWKLGGYGEEETGTLRPHQTREPLPVFNAPSSVAETTSSARNASVSPSPVPVRRRSHPVEPKYGEGSNTPLARSLYHDPLHLPSLFALAASVLPRTIGRLFNGTLGRAGGMGGKGDDGGNGWGRLGVLIGVGAACAATFCAG